MMMHLQRVRLLQLIVLILLFNVTAVFAHETPIALLDVYERKSGEFALQWTYSSSTNQYPPVAVFPDHCNYKYPTLDCGELGLSGQMKLLQLGERYSAAVVKIKRIEGHTQTFTLTGANPAVYISQEGSFPIRQVAASYIPLGIEHILLGVDHLLFVLGLIILVRVRWALVKTITSFTIAHSISLAAASFGWVGVPEKVVNATIALSIVFLAVEILQKRDQPSFSARWPWAIAFGFGLLHGFGFASALTEIGLPEENLPAALLFFNVGVELGQLCFVLIVLALLWSHRVLGMLWTERREAVTAYGIGSVASYWFVSRFFVLIG